MLRHSSANAIVPIPNVARSERCATSGSATTGQGTRLGGTAETPSKRNPRAISAAKTAMTPTPAGRVFGSVSSTAAGTALPPRVCVVVFSRRPARVPLTRTTRGRAFAEEARWARLSRRVVGATRVVILRAGRLAGCEETLVGVLSAGAACTGAGGGGGGGGGGGFGLVCCGLGSGSGGGGLGSGAGPVDAAVLADPVEAAAAVSAVTCAGEACPASATDDQKQSAQTPSKPSVVAIPIVRERGGAAPAPPLIRGVCVASGPSARPR